MKKSTKGALIAAAAAGLFGMASASWAADGNSDSATDKDTVQCFGVNSCKGQGSCHSAENACAGHNACKGKGWVDLTEKECKDKGGHTKDE